MNLPDPSKMTFRDWADELYFQSTKFTAPLPYDEKSWQGWAERVVQNCTTPLPDPIYYLKWQDWAERVVAALQGE